MREINRIIQKVRKAVTSSSSETSGSNASDLPLDHQLNFNRGPNEHWSFREGHILLNDEDIEGVLDSSRNDVRFQSAVSDAVAEYKDEVWRRGGEYFDRFCASADSVQDRILCNMKRIYDEKTQGMRFAYGEGGYLLNNVNIRAIVALYHIRPTEKARRFLSGLKAKLNLILANKSGSPGFERLNNVIKLLYNEVEDALNNTPPDAHYLPLHGGDSNI